MAMSRSWGLLLIGLGAFKISFIPTFGRLCQPCFHPMGAAFTPVQAPRLDGVEKLPWDVPSKRDLVWGWCALGGQHSRVLQGSPLWTVLTFLGSLRLAMCRV